MFCGLSCGPLCRGQLDGIMGGPPKDETGELKKKLMFLWMVAEKGAVVNDLRKPFLFMELGEKSGWWNSEDWNRLKREYLLTVSRVQGDDTVVYHAATNLNLIDYNGQEESATGTTWDFVKVDLVIGYNLSTEH